MTALGLCIALALTPELPRSAAYQGCRMAADFVDAGHRYQHDPLLLVAIAWRETAIKPHLVGADGECGAMQVLPRFARLTCRELQGQPGVEAGAGALRRWKGSLYRYNCGYRNRPRCDAYVRAVLANLKKLRKHSG